MSEQTVTVRRATAEDAQRIAGLFQSSYGKSSHPCKDYQYIRDGIESGTTEWKIAVDQERLVACISLLLNAWNRSWELARAVTVPEYRRSGLGTELMQQSLGDACASSSCDVIIGFPRSRTMLHILCEGLKPPMLPVGHDGAINVANNMREYHIVGFTANPRAKFHHYIPSSSSLASTDFVRTNVFRPLGFSPTPGEYPPLCIVGDGIKHPDLAPFSFTYNPFCPSDSIEITGYTSGFGDARKVARELVLMLESYYHARHARLMVLVDKTELIESLAAAGFEVTAYLPAWYHYGNARYDCVLMVRGQFSEEPSDQGVRDVVEYFREGLGQR